MTLTQLNNLAKEKGVEEINIRALDEDGIAWTDALIYDEEKELEDELTIYVIGE